MKIVFKSIGGLGILFFIATVWAQDNNNIMFKDKQVYLNSSMNQHVYVLHNVTQGIVMINHVTQNPGASAGWMSQIGPGNWSAIAVDKANFSLACMLYSPPHIGLVDCQKVISVSDSNIAAHGGTYWVFENKNKPIN